MHCLGSFRLRYVLKSQCIYIWGTIYQIFSAHVAYLHPILWHGVLLFDKNCLQAAVFWFLPCAKIMMLYLPFYQLSVVRQEQTNQVLCGWADGGFENKESAALVTAILPLIAWWLKTCVSDPQRKKNHLPPVHLTNWHPFLMCLSCYWSWISSSSK